MKKTKNSIISGIKSDLIIFILKIILGFGVIPAYLYFLDLDEFGVYVAVQSIIALLAIADIGLGQYVVKKLSNKEYYDQHALYFLPSVQVFQYLLACCLFIVGIVGLYFVSEFLNVEEKLKKEVNWLFVFSWSAVTFKTTFGLIPSVLQAKSQLAYLNIMNFLILLFSAVINILFLSIGYGLSSLGLSLLIANMVVFFIMYLRLNKYTTYRFLLPTKFDKTYVYDGWNYVKKFQLLKIGQLAKSSLFIVLLSKFAGAPAVAFYNITNKMPLIFPELMSKLSLNYFTHFASLYEQGLIDELKIEYQKIFNLGLQSAYFILFSLFFLNEVFISIWVGSEKFIGKDTFIFMLLNVGILLLNSFTGLIIQISGEFKKTPLFSFLEIVLMLILTKFLFEFYGIEGIIFALFISSLPSFLYSMSVVKWVLSIKLIDTFKDNFKNVFLMSVFMPLIHLISNEMITVDIIRLFVESFLLTTFFIFIQRDLLPENLRFIYKRTLK